MNYTDKQIKLAGVIQPEGGAREFEQGLDLQGEGVRVLQNDSTIFEENTGDCCEDLQTCELAVNACEAERLNDQIVIDDLLTENGELTEENAELTALANGELGSCAGTSYQNSTGRFNYGGTVCFSGTSGALSVTWGGTWWSPIGLGGGSSSGTLTGTFVDESLAQVGVTSLAVSFDAQYTNENFESGSFSDSDTSTRNIPASAVAVRWRGGIPTRNIAYTFL